MCFSQAPIGGTWCISGTASKSGGDFVMSVVLAGTERPTIQSNVRKGRVPGFEGSPITFSAVTGMFGFNDDESRRWNQFKKTDPHLLYNPATNMRFGDGQAVLLVWYQEEGGAFQLQCVKPGAGIPTAWVNIEVYQGEKDKNTPEWKKRLLASMDAKEVVAPVRISAPRSSSHVGNAQGQPRKHQFTRGRFIPR